LPAPEQWPTWFWFCRFKFLAELVAVSMPATTAVAKTKQMICDVLTNSLPLVLHMRSRATRESCGPDAPISISALANEFRVYAECAMDWDDLRFVLAVCRGGSALAAAEELDVNQSTVTRRIEHIEKDLGVQLFERRQSGYVPTPHGLLVADTAERLEKAVRDLQSAIAARRRVLTGTVRLTTNEMLANRIVAPWLPSFQKLHPRVRIELVADDRRLNLARGEADVALRASSRPEGPGIVIRRMPGVAWAVYCSRGYADEHGTPTSRERIRAHAVVGLEGRLAQLQGPRWIKAAARDTRVRFRSNSLTNLVSSLRAGLGVATLPCIVGDSELELVRCFPPPPELEAEMWLILREGSKSAPQIRALADHLAAYLHSIRAQLAGVSV
jgi:DNA-binding transcriptional LysR family regulator